MTLTLAVRFNLADISTICHIKLRETVVPEITLLTLCQVPSPSNQASKTCFNLRIPAHNSLGYTFRITILTAMLKQPIVQFFGVQTHNCSMLISMVKDDGRLQ